MSRIERLHHLDRPATSGCRAHPPLALARKLFGARQVGFGRVISDRATFAYLADVFVLDAHRGQGLSKRLMETILAHPELQGLRRWMLATRDAHSLYEQFGFTLPKVAGRIMERTDPDAYLVKS